MIHRIPADDTYHDAWSGCPCHPQLRLISYKGRRRLGYVHRRGLGDNRPPDGAVQVLGGERAD